MPRRVWARRLLVGLRRIPMIVASRQLEDIASKHWWVTGDRLCFIANGVSIPTLSPKMRAITSKDQSDLPIVIGTVAVLRPEKNIARLLRAFAALHKVYQARLVIVGDGPERASLEALAISLGIATCVEFTGYLKSPSIKLTEFDVFALSSDTEQLPIAMLEAMASGMPVVTTNVGDVAKIIPPAAHELISEANDSAFEKALFRAVQRRDQWPIWADEGRRIVVRDYNLDSMLKAWDMVFEGQWEKAFLAIREQHGHE